MAVVTAGDVNAKIYVLCEPPVEGKYDPKNPGTASHINLFLMEAKKAGFKTSDFCFIKLCDPISENIKVSKAKTWKHILPYLEELTPFLDEAKAKAKFIVPMGDLATRAVMGKAHAITKCRGTVLNGNVYPVFSIAYIHRSLEQLPTFQADINTLKKLSDNNFDITKIAELKPNYYYCTDLTQVINSKPKFISVDTETTGLRPRAPGFKVLVVQIGYTDNDVAIVPLHENFWPADVPIERMPIVREQLKQLLQDTSVKKIGHNFNYDVSALEAEGIEVKGILADTQLLAWFLDENMFSKTLDDCTRRWYPPLAGYNDHWNSVIDKSDMINLDMETMRIYGGGDACATRNVFNYQWNELKKNPRLYNLFIKLKMPGLIAFRKMEREGIRVDLPTLNKLKTDVIEDLARIEKQLIDKVPRAVIRKHLDSKVKNPLRFSRDAFVRDILFSPEGFNLTPVVFTKGTKKEQNLADRVPSVSAKDHLPYFTDIEGVAGDFVHEFIEYTKLDKLYTTYIRDFADKYVHEDGKIHPQFVLHITTTGRTSSRGPNAQNFPARGNWAKPYKKIFTAGEGYKFVSADLSQIELRLIAWESQDPRMLQAYRNGEDIHTITAMAVSGHTYETWEQLSKEDRKLLRYRAKAVNFGFCIAENELVLTNEGLMPIQQVKDWHLLWDGVEWVKHDGVIFKGEKEIIEFDGLRATPDHKIYTKDGRKVSFGNIASKMDTGSIAIGAIGTVPVRYDEFDRKSRKETEESPLCRNSLFELSNNEMDFGRQYFRKENYQLYLSEREVQGYQSENIGRTLRCNDSAMLSRYPHFFEKLQRSRNHSGIQIQRGIYSLGSRNFSKYEFHRTRFRQGEQRRKLFERELEVGGSIYQFKESKKVKVYDILNAGPRHRFTVSGKIVSNCYEMGAPKFQRYAKTDYGIDLSQDEAKYYYDTYHNLYRHIKKWHARRKIELSQNGYVTSLHGSVRRLSSIYSNDKFIRSQAERQAINTPIQCFGSDLGVAAIARIARQVDHEIISPVAFIHDDVILRVKDGHEEEAVNMLLWVLNNPPLKTLFDLEPPIPIIAEPDIGKSLGEMYELYDLPKELPDWWVPINIDPKKPTWWDDKKDLI